MTAAHDYLRVGDAARYLGISPSTLRNWERAGKIASYRHPVSRYRLFKRADLDAFLADIEHSRRGPATRSSPDPHGRMSTSEGTN